VRRLADGYETSAPHRPSGAMTARASMPQRHSRPDRRRAASLLLLVLVGGLAIMMFTRDWLRSAPVHDHILFGAPASSLAHHTHTWDELDHASTAWQSVEPTTPASPSDAGAPDGRVVSLHAAAGALLESLNFTLVIGVAYLLGRFGPGGGLRLVPGESCHVVGQLPGPPLPPPRSA
jgi:hypothetical protein